MEICVIIKRYVQISPDDWELRRISRVFSSDRTISDILKWVESEGIKNATVNDFELCDHTGSSL